MIILDSMREQTIRVRPFLSNDLLEIDTCDGPGLIQTGSLLRVADGRLELIGSGRDGRGYPVHPLTIPLKEGSLECLQAYPNDTEWELLP